VRSQQAVLFAAFLAAGCGGDKGSPKPVSGPAKEAATLVQALEKATAAGDFQRVCDQLLSSSERRQAGGEQCAAIMSERARDVKRPRIRILSIAVNEAGALVRVRTTAVGQAPVDDIIKLVREQGRYRIAALGR